MASNDRASPPSSSTPYQFPLSSPGSLLCPHSSPTFLCYFCNPSSNLPQPSPSEFPPPTPFPDTINANEHDQSFSFANYIYQSPNPSVVASSSSLASTAATSTYIDVPPSSLLAAGGSSLLSTARSFDGATLSSCSPEDFLWAEALADLSTIPNYVDDFDLPPCPNSAQVLSECVPCNSVPISSHPSYGAHPGGLENFGLQSMGSDEDQVVCIRVCTTNLRLCDGYFWRKYGEKNIKTQRSRRNYFKCAERGCHAEKHAQYCSDDPKNYVLVTYSGKHNHAPQSL